jgi:hypothetical protein
MTEVIEIKEKKNIDRGTYFKDYYQANKEKCLARLNEKQACLHCSRMVSYAFMHKHIKSKICMKNRPKTTPKQEAVDIEALKKQIKAEILIELAPADASA